MNLIQRKNFLSQFLAEIGGLSGFVKQVIAHYEDIHISAEETGEGVLWCADNGFASDIEACIDNQAIACQRLKCTKELMIAGIGPPGGLSESGQKNRYVSQREYQHAACRAFPEGASCDNCPATHCAWNPAQDGPIAYRETDGPSENILYKIRPEQKEQKAENSPVA